MLALPNGVFVIRVTGLWKQAPDCLTNQTDSNILPLEKLIQYSWWTEGTGRRLSLVNASLCADTAQMCVLGWGRGFTGYIPGVFHNTHCPVLGTEFSKSPLISLNISCLLCPSLFMPVNSLVHKVLLGLQGQGQV